MSMTTDSPETPPGMEMGRRPVVHACLDNLVQLRSSWKVVHRDIVSVIGESEHDATTHASRGIRDQDEPFAELRLGLG